MIKHYEDYNVSTELSDGTELNLTFTLIQWVAPDEEPEEKLACKDRAAMNYYPGTATHDETLCIYLASQSQPE